MSLLFVLSACVGVPTLQLPDGFDAGSTSDAGLDDAGLDDAGLSDAGLDDAGLDDAGLDDAGLDDAGLDDAGRSDAGLSDAGLDDAGRGDAGLSDAGSSDAGRSDAGLIDAGTGDAGRPDAGVDAGLPVSCTTDAQCAASDACDVSWCSAGTCTHAPRVCNAPPAPPGDPFASCRDGGTTFRATLGGTCGNTRCLPSSGCVYEQVEVSCPPADTLTTPALAGRLPQTRPWQVMLRNWLATLQAQDFTITLPSPAFTFVPSQFPDSDVQARERLFEAWLVYGQGRELPDLKGVRLPASRFPLSAVEDTAGGAVRMRVGYRGWFQPESTAYWAQWSWPGNPYFQQRPVRLRALASTAIDLVMSTQAFADNPGYAINDMGGVVTRASYPYLVARTELDACTRAAYEQGLRELFTIVEQESWTTANGNNDIALSMFAGMAWAARATSDPELKQRAIARTKALFAASMHHPAGWFEHSNPVDPGAGFDSSYEGITTYHVTTAVLATLDDPDFEFLRAELRKMIALKAALTLPGLGTFPGGAVNGATGRMVISPVSFCPATNGGAAWDQWFGRARDYGLAAFSDEAAYLPFSGRPTDFYRIQGLPTVAQLKADLASMVTPNTTDDLNRVGGLADPTTPYLPENDPRAPGWLRWAADGWTEHLGASQLLPAGAYARLSQLVASSSPLRALPFERPGSFVRTFEKDFVVAKLGGFGVVLHLGPVGRDWGDSGNVGNRDVLVTGFGGGALAAFSTPDAGPVLLAVARGYQAFGPLPDGGVGPTQDRWDEWRDWQVHAVSGQTVGGKVFSSARILNPVVTLSAQATSATATATGPITWDFTTHVASQSGALTSPLTYARQFSLDATGLTVTTSLTGDGSAQLSELVETLPVHLYGGVSAAHKPAGVVPTIVLTTTSGPVTWAADVAGAQVATGVSRLDVLRGGHGVRVVFQGGTRTVRLSPAVWKASSQQYLEGRALRIDLLPSAPPVALTSASVTYTLSPVP